MKKFTLEEFIGRSNNIHYNKYDYSLVEYINSKIKIKIICQEHGEFLQTPYHHTVRKQGCPICSKAFNPTTFGFIQKSKEINGNKYDYSLVEYIKFNKKVKIICPYHGIFEQNPLNHIHLKHGCPKCSKNIDTSDEFIKKCNDLHNNKYDYSIIEYTNKRSRIKIICPDHGIFEQYSYAHLDKKQGCPVCSESKGERTITSYLNNLNILYEKQKTFVNCKNVYVIPFDFYLPEHNICIEFDGIQHFKSIEYWGGEEYLKKQKLRDKIKTEYCKDNNIKLIRIRYNENINQDKLETLLK